MYKVVSDHEFRTLFMLAIFSGARQGELLGLKWSDVDWKIDKFAYRGHLTSNLGMTRKRRLQTEGLI